MLSRQSSASTSRRPAAASHDKNPNHLERDRVRPDRRADREDAGRRIAMARRLDQEVAPRAVHPGEHDDSLAGREVAQSRPPRLVDHDPRLAAPLARLAEVLRAVVAGLPGRMRAADEDEPGVGRKARRVERGADFSWALPCGPCPGLSAPLAPAPGADVAASALPGSRQAALTAARNDIKISLYRSWVEAHGPFRRPRRQPDEGGRRRDANPPSVAASARRAHGEGADGDSRPVAAAHLPPSEDTGRGRARVAHAGRLLGLLPPLRRRRGRRGRAWDRQGARRDGRALATRQRAPRQPAGSRTARPPSAISPSMRAAGTPSARCTCRSGRSRRRCFSAPGRGRFAPCSISAPAPGACWSSSPAAPSARSASISRRRCSRSRAPIWSARRSRMRASGSAT